MDRSWPRVIHEHEDTSTQILYPASTFVLYVLQYHLEDQHLRRPICLSHIQELNKRSFAVKQTDNFSRTKGAKNLIADNTHVEVICCWVINHLNEINYIRMA